MKRLGLDEVWWLISPQNPLKSSKDMAPLAVRCAYAKAVARHPHIIPTTIEADLGTSYTIDTVQALQKRFPHTQFVWLMGADNLRQIRRWRRWQDIFKRVPVAVFRRPAYAVGRKCGVAAERFDRAWIPVSMSRRLVQQKPPAWLILDNPLNPTSATEIRKDLPTWPKQKRP